jgi:hypothetical protein
LAAEAAAIPRFVFGFMTNESGTSGSTPALLSRDEKSVRKKICRISSPRRRKSAALFQLPLRHLEQPAIHLVTLGNFVFGPGFALNVLPAQVPSPFASELPRLCLDATISTASC